MSSSPRSKRLAARIGEELPAAPGVGGDIAPVAKRARLKHDDSQTEDPQDIEPAPVGDLFPNDAAAAAVNAEEGMDPFQQTAVGQQQQQPPQPQDEAAKMDSEIKEEDAMTAAAKVAEDRKAGIVPAYESIKANPTDPEYFNHYLFALLSYKSEHGNYQVHKEDCPNLYAWLSFVKREYARFNHQPSVSNMTAEQRQVLEFLHVPLTHRGDDHWNRFYAMLESYKTRHGHVLVPRVCEVPGLGDWVTDQRRQHKAWKGGKPSQMTKERRERLEKLGFTWQVRCRPEWDQRFAELMEYKSKYGDCKVPQHYRDNRALGKWVAKQREQYKLKKKGQHSFLTPDREERLNSVGFIWQVRTGIPEEEERHQLRHVAAAAAAAAAAAKASPGASADQHGGGVANDPLAAQPMQTQHI